MNDKLKINIFAPKNECAASKLLICILFKVQLAFKLNYKNLNISVVFRNNFS